MSLCSVMLISGCMKDEPLRRPYNGSVPLKTGDGWELSTPESEGIDPVGLEGVYKKIYNEELYPNIRSLLVVRNGKLVSEYYFRDPYDMDRLHAVMSVTKSITSLVTGIAMDKGFISSLDDPLYMFIPEYFDDVPLKRSITLRHLLTMEAGLDFDDDVHTGEMMHYPGSSLKYVLSRPMVFEPGTDWYYGDGNPQLISGVISRVTGKTLNNLAGEYLFGPIGIDDYYWEDHSDGVTLGGMGLWMKPRDMAKIGQLMLSKGSWNGSQLVSTDWIAQSTIRQADHRDYGYYWLTGEDGIYWANGQGGQIIWLYPDKELVVVLTSDSFARSWLLSPGSYDEIFQGIYNSLKE